MAKVSMSDVRLPTRCISVLVLPSGFVFSFSTAVQYLPSSPQLPIQQSFVDCSGSIALTVSLSAASFPMIPM